MRNRDGTDTKDCLAQKPTFITTVFYSSSPQPLALRTVLWKTIFPWVGVEDGFRMIQAHHIYCAFYFYYFYISFTSDHWALDLGGRGPLLYSPSTLETCFKSVGKEELGLDSCDESVLFPMPSKLLRKEETHGDMCPLHLRIASMRQVLDLESGLTERILSMR